MIGCVACCGPVEDAESLIPWGALVHVCTQTMKLFDIRSLKTELSSMLCEPRDVSSVAWHPFAETMFAAGHQDGTMSFWVTASDKPQAVLKGAHDQAIWSLDWHPVGHMLATGGCVGLNLLPSLFFDNFVNFRRLCVQKRLPDAVLVSPAPRRSC